MLSQWATFANQLKEESVSTQKELTNLRTKVTNTYHRSEDLMDTTSNIHQMVERLHAEDLSFPLIKEEELSPRELASQALYADRHSTEDSVEYEQRQKAQVRFEKNPLPFVRKTRDGRPSKADNTRPPPLPPSARIEEVEENKTTTLRIKERGKKNSPIPRIAPDEQISPEEQYAIEMALSQSRAMDQTSQRENPGPPSNRQGYGDP